MKYKRVRVNSSNGCKGCCFSENRKLDRIGREDGDCVVIDKNGVFRDYIYKEVKDEVQKD